jgi:hypothetical protein
MLIITSAHFHGWKTTLGGFCIHLVLGTLYLWSNLSIYITSYLRKYQSDVTSNDTLLVFSVAIGVQGVCMVAGGVLEKVIGARWTCLCGGYALVCGMMLASVSTSLVDIVLTQGLLFGVGMGLCYSLPITAAARWLPRSKGLIAGVVVSGFGLGSFVFGNLAINVVNPERLPTLEDYYPPDSAIVARVPLMYRTLAAMYCVLVTVGAFFISSPPPSPPPPSYDGGGAGSTDCASADGYKAVGQSDAAAGHVLAVPTGIGPLELVKTPLAWHLASCFITTTVGGMFLCGTYKTYAKAAFNDENFLSQVGSTAALFSCVGRWMWGALGDSIGPVEALMLLSSLLTLVIFAYSYSTRYGEFSFAFVTYSMFALEGGNFALYLPATISAFGATYAAQNFGLLFSCYSLAVMVTLTVLASNDVSFDTACKLMSLLTFCGTVNVGLFWRALRSSTVKTECLKDSA